MRKSTRTNKSKINHTRGNHVEIILLKTKSADRQLNNITLLFLYIYNRIR